MQQVGILQLCYYSVILPEYEIKFSSTRSWAKYLKNCHQKLIKTYNRVRETRTQIKQQVIGQYYPDVETRLRPQSVDEKRGCLT